MKKILFILFSALTSLMLLNCEGNITLDSQKSVKEVIIKDTQPIMSVISGSRGIGHYDDTPYIRIDIIPPKNLGKRIDGTPLIESEVSYVAWVLLVKPNDRNKTSEEIKNNGYFIDSHHYNTNDKYIQISGRSYRSGKYYANFYLHKDQSYWIVIAGVNTTLHPSHPYYLSELSNPVFITIGGGYFGFYPTEPKYTTTGENTNVLIIDIEGSEYKGSTNGKDEQTVNTYDIYYIQDDDTTVLSNSEIKRKAKIETTSNIGGVITNVSEGVNKITNLQEGKLYHIVIEAINTIGSGENEKSLRKIGSSKIQTTIGLAERMEKLYF